MEAFTVKFRALAFKMISRAGCYVAEVLQHPHRQLPYQLFALLRDPSKKADDEFRTRMGSVPIRSSGTVVTASFAYRL